MTANQKLNCCSKVLHQYYWFDVSIYYDYMPLRYNNRISILEINPDFYIFCSMDYGLYFSLDKPIFSSSMKHDDGIE